MATTYRETVKENGEDPSEEVRKFVSHLFSQIYQELHSVHKFGSQADPVGQMWYAI